MTVDGQGENRTAQIAAAAFAGVITGLAVASPRAAPLAWLSLVPLLSRLGTAGRRAAVTAGVVYATVGAAFAILPWLIPATAAYFELSRPRAFAYLAPALFAVSAVHGAVLGVVLSMRPRSCGPWAVIWYGAVWACWEAARTIVFPYYPAAVLGTSQHNALPVLQIASLCGIEGVTFVVVAVNAAVAAVLEGRESIGRRAAAAVTALAIAGGVIGWGATRISGATGERAQGPSIVAVNVNAREPASGSLDRYLAASAENEAMRLGLLIWPENALTTDIERDRAAWTRLSGFVAARAVPLLTGGPGSARRSGPVLARFNSAHLLSPAGGVRSYHKRDLVPLAERWLPILGDPPADLASLDAGTEDTVFPLGETAFGVLICFEIADGVGARTLVRRGARFIVNLTNDAWFRTGTAPHVAWAAVRAVETGLPVVRAANAGVSAVFDRFGRPVATNGTVDRASVLTATLPSAVPTPYAGMGDVFLAACLVTVVVGCARSFAARGVVRA